MSRVRIGDLLVKNGLVSPADLNSGLEIQRTVGGRLGMILVRLGALSEADLLKCLSQQLGLAVQTREEMPSPDQVKVLIDNTQTQASWWADQEAVAWWADPAGDLLVCVAVDPLNPLLRSVIDQTAAIRVEWRLCPRSLISAAIDDLDHPQYLNTGSASADAAQLREMAEEAPVIDFVNAVFAESLQRRASDIHVEPFEDRFIVRMRVDGILQTIRTAPRSSFDAVCSRLKLLSGMDIGERRLPQDGRQTIRISGQDIDLRVSTLPAAWGESLVMRLLGKTSRIPELTELGLPAEDAAGLARLVEQPNGIVLITGPTGSGKTTTIYRLLSGLNDGLRKIVTVEDPVEFDLPGVVQVHVRSDIGLTFAAGLRSILRQDPDVIMVGEIRDPETARIAVQAALTGHMVISTVHTNSAIAAVPRLIDLGVENYLLADVLRGLVGQRLVRKLCSVCAIEDHDQHWEGFASPKLSASLAGLPPRFMKPVGCEKCGGSGYLGRIGLYEIAQFTPDLASGVRRNASEVELTKMVTDRGFIDMFQDGVMKSARGLTTMAEVFRVIGTGELTDQESSRTLTTDPAF
jgi:general secretion pathway protein E